MEGIQEQEKVYCYVYMVVREDFATGKRGNRAKKYFASGPELEVGGLYVHLGKGYPGCQRVLSVHIHEI